MKDDAPRVIKIPAKPEATRQAEARRQLRVAAYCRVSTKEEDQANSYEVQKEYYTDKIMSNTAWTMAGIFADKGITGTSAKKREDFMRMIRHCRQKKIDVILTKSVSRFSRNTVDCLYYIRALKQLGIAVIFEKENINSLEEKLLAKFKYTNVITPSKNSPTIKTGTIRPIDELFNKKSRFNAMALSM